MTAAKQTKTKTADTVEMQRDSFDRLAKVMEGMRRMFVTDTHTLKPYAVSRKWATMDCTEVAVLLIAGGKGKGKDRNPKFKVGGVFATASLAEKEARDLGIDGKDIVRSWDDDITGDSIQLDTLYTQGKTIPMGKAVIVWVRVEGLALNAARLCEGVGFDPMGSDDAARKEALDALFDPMNPKGIPEVWVSLDFTLKTECDLWSSRKPSKVPTVGLRVLASDPKTYPPQSAQGRADEFVKVAVTRTA